MDPTARRETWKLIEDAKKGRLIILTTHYMDEAEYLADRVAIVSKG
jgi:ABC-type multidrug transport system ATPase subunit